MTIDDVVPGGAALDQVPQAGLAGECVFCEIVAGRAEASLVYADEIVIAFMDIAPVNPGHVLVIPREHSAGLADLDEEQGAQIWRVGHRVANALRHSGLRVEGLNFFLADGRVAFQEVFHVHLHILPRYADDDFKVQAPSVRSERAELDSNAAKIGRALTTAV